MNHAHRTFTSWVLVAIFMMAAALQAYLIVSSAYIAIVLSLAALFFLLFYNAPVALLMILIFFFPFSGTEAFKNAMAAIPGFKPLQILSMALLVVALINIRNAVRLPRYAVFFYAAVIILFTISFVRSVPNISEVNAMLSERLSVLRYFLSEYFKPLIYFIPAIILTQYVHSKKNIDRIVLTINWSIVIMSISLIGFFFYNRNLILDPSSTRSFYGSSFGLHTNSIANYYIIGFPFVLTDLFRRKALPGSIKVVLCTIGISLLFSRSAYYIFIFSFLAYLFFSKRRKYLPVFMILVLLLVFIVPGSVTKRATKGFASGNRNQIFAGRVDNLWLPLIKEISGDYKTLLLGKGRFGLLSTQAHKKNLVIQAMHPHNMYLEMVLDAGLLGLSVFLGLFGFLFKKVYRCMRAAEGTPYREYSVAVITSLVCFLISGLTDRTFFPDEINGYLWLMVGLAFVLCRQVEDVKSKKVNNFMPVSESRFAG